MGICIRLIKDFGNSRLRIHIFILFSLFIFFGCADRQKPIKPEVSIPLEPERPAPPVMTIDRGIDKLVREVSKSLASERRPKIAVMDLLGPNDNHTQLGSFISEKLITKLFISGRFEKVLERKLLRDLLVQQKIEMEGYFNEDTVKSVVGKIGIDAIVMGFITDHGSRVDVNVRLIDTNGEILSVAEAEIDKDWVVNNMLQGVKRATLTVAVNPSDVKASVTVGEKVVRCIDGIAVFRNVPQGNRSILITAQGYEIVHESVYLTDDRGITIPLTPKKAFLQRLKSETLTVEATGEGVYPENPSLSLVQKKLMAKRAATIDAYRKLLEKVNEIEIGSESKMKDLLIQHDEVTAKVSGFIRGAKIIEVRDKQDGIVEVDVIIKLGKDFFDTFKPYIK